MFDTKVFGCRMKQLRIYHNLTHEEVANRLNISLNHEYRLKSGNRTPTIDLCLQIGECFHISMDQLLAGNTSASRSEKQLLLEAMQLLSDLEQRLP